MPLFISFLMQTISHVTFVKLRTCDNDLMPMLPMMLTRWTPLKRTMATPRTCREMAGPQDMSMRSTQLTISALMADWCGTVTSTASELSIIAHTNPLYVGLV